MYVNNRMNKYQTNEQLKKRHAMQKVAINESKKNAIRAYNFKINETVKKNAIKENTRSNANRAPNGYKSKIMGWLKKRKNNYDTKKKENIIKHKDNPTVKKFVTKSDNELQLFKYNIDNSLEHINKKILEEKVQKKSGTMPNNPTVNKLRNEIITEMCYNDHKYYPNEEITLPTLKHQFRDDESATVCISAWKQTRDKLLCKKFSNNDKIYTGPICSKFTEHVLKNPDRSNSTDKEKLQINKFIEMYKKISRVTSFDSDTIKRFQKYINKSLDKFFMLKNVEQIKLIEDFNLFNTFLKTTRFHDFKGYSTKTDITNEEKEQLKKDFNIFKMDILINNMNFNEYFKKFLIIKSIPFDKYSDYNNPTDKIKLITEYDIFINYVGTYKIKSDEFIDFLLMKSITFDKNTNMQSIKYIINTLIEEFIQFLAVLKKKNITFSEFKDFLLMKSIKFEKYTDMVKSINAHIAKCAKFHDFFKKDNTTFSEFKEFLKIIKSKDFHTYTNDTLNEKINLINEFKRFDKKLKNTQYGSVAKYIGDTDIKTEDKQKYFMDIMSKNNETNSKNNETNSNKNVLLNESILLGGKRQTRRKRNKHQKNTISRCHL